jgi:Domain of unknown function (DUF2017)
MPSFRAPVSATRDGRYRLRLGDAERELVRGLCGDLRELVRRGEEVDRLYPAAYRDDEEAADEFSQLVHTDLKTQRLEALDLVARTLDADVLDQGEAEAWCGALNDLRLVLGERLGVSEDTDLGAISLLRDPRARELALYGWLTYLQGTLVEALASRL